MRAFLLALLIACCFPATAGALPLDPFGVAIGGDLANNAATQPAEFAKMRAGGLRYARVDASWGYIQPSPTIWQWAVYDTLVANLARADMYMYPILCYSTPWAASTVGDPFTPPADHTVFANFASEVAKRYGVNGSFWLARSDLPYRPVRNFEVWNEPNYDLFWHGPLATPANYADLYLAARTAIHAVNPATRVVTGGLLDSSDSDGPVGLNGKAWLSSMLSSMTITEHASVDALGWHPYRQEPDNLITATNSVAAMLTSFGLVNRPIEITEVGFFAYGYKPRSQGKKKPLIYDWANRADRIYESTARILEDAPTVTRFIPYVWGNDSTWGLNYPNGEGTAAYFDGIAAALAGEAPRATNLRRSRQVRKKG